MGESKMADRGVGRVGVLRWWTDARHEGDMLESRAERVGFERTAM